MKVPPRHLQPSVVLCRHLVGNGGNASWTSWEPSVPGGEEGDDEEEAVTHVWVVAPALARQGVPVMGRAEPKEASVRSPPPL